MKKFILDTWTWMHEIGYWTDWLLGRAGAMLADIIQVVNHDARPFLPLWNGLSLVQSMLIDLLWMTCSTNKEQASYKAFQWKSRLTDQSLHLDNLSRITLHSVNLSSMHKEMSGNSSNICAYVQLQTKPSCQACHQRTPLVTEVTNTRAGAGVAATTFNEAPL